MVSITAYQTDDGQVFASQAEAQRNDESLALLELIRSDLENPDEALPIVRWIVKNRRALLTVLGVPSTNGKSEPASESASDGAWAMTRQTLGERDMLIAQLREQHETAQAQASAERALAAQRLDEIERLTAQLAAKDAALAPFVELAREWSERWPDEHLVGVDGTKNKTDYLAVGDLRRAAAAAARPAG